MTKARILADFISDGSPLADGTISVAEVTGAAPLASPTFTGTVTATSLDISGDIDVDGITNLDVVDIDGAVNMASTLQVTGTANFSDRIGSTYVYPKDAYGQTGVVTNYFWKMGRINIAGPAAAEIKLYGLQGYGQGNEIVGTNTIQLRGSNSATVLDGCFHAIGDAGIGIQEMRYVPIGGFVFDLYVKLGPYFSLSTTVVSGGTWVPEWTNTGSGSNPASSVDIPAQYALVLGSTLPMHANLTEVAFNDYSNDLDFRVESDTNTHALFVEGSSGNVGIMDSTPTSTLNVHGNKSFVWNASGIENVATTTIGSRTTTDGSNSFAVAGTTHNSYYPSSWVVDSAHDGTNNITYFDLTAYGVKYGGWTGAMRLNTSQGGAVHEALRLKDAEAVFNELGNNTDFRVESDAGPYAFYMDAGANSGYGRTKITSYAPSSNTSVAGGTSDTYINGLTIENNEASYTNGGLALVNKFSWGYGSSIKWYNVYDGAGTGGTLGETNRIQGQYISANNYETVFYSMIGGAVTETLSIGANGTIVNDGGLDNDFRVESDTNTHALFVDAGVDRISMGTSDSSDGTLTLRSTNNNFAMVQEAAVALPGGNLRGRMYEGTYSIVGNNLNNQLKIPIFYQGGLWIQYQVELSVVTAEYNNNSVAKGGSCIFSFVSLTALGALVQQQVTGNISSVALDSANMNVLINFSSAYTAGQSNYEGVIVHAKVLSYAGQYVEMDNATLN